MPEKELFAGDRAVGIEIEFNGLKLEQAVEIVRQHVEGKLTAKNDFRHAIIHDELGEFIIEVDYHLLQTLAETSKIKGKDSLEAYATDILSPLSEPFAPLEVVTPPLTSQYFSLYEEIIQSLREAGAKGTERSPINAYGLHINVELKDLSAKTITKYLQSFCLLYDWLKTKMQIDFSRSLSTYVSGYSSNYAELILDKNYQPDMRQLMQDYLKHQTSRNYALDMLPMFAHIDSEFIDSQIDEPLNKSRPAFHFRMPNCRIDKPNWTFKSEWCHWLAVEKVAQDDELRGTLIEEFNKNSERFLRHFDSQWVTLVEYYLG